MGLCVWILTILFKMVLYSSGGAYYDRVLKSLLPLLSIITVCKVCRVAVQGIGCCLVA